MGIIVVGLGPGDGRFLTREAWELFSQTEKVYLRTERHPAVVDLPPRLEQISFDAIYDSAESFEAVYQAIVEKLVQLGRETDILYAVPGHPLVGESTVLRLLELAEAEAVDVKIVAGLSFVEPVLTAVQADGMNGVQLFDAIEITQYHYPPINSDFPVLLGQVYNNFLASELKLTLTQIYPDEHPIYLVHGAGLPEEIVEAIPLYEIDRSEHISHLSSLYLPPLSFPSTVTALAETVAILRSPDGCPWDQEQTPQSMRSGFLEEASEVLEALDQEDVIGLQEELGDMFYHLLMQTQMAGEGELFKLTDVLIGIDAKLKRRHPHVWGDWQVADSDEVIVNWEKIKEQEKAQAPQSMLDNIPLALPALARSQKIQERVRKIGFDWSEIQSVYNKVYEEMDELKQAQTPLEQTDELGDVLFVLVNLAKWLNIDAESALRQANLKFDRRFRQVEQLAVARQLELASMSLEELDLLWQEVKRQEKLD